MSRLALSDLRARYVDERRSLPLAVEAALRSDPRAGAKAILAAVARRRHDHRSEGQRLRKICRYEDALWASGVTRVAGIDEAGMSPLAGPVAAGAVVFAPHTRMIGVDDSKKLDTRERERLAPLIKTTCVAWGVGFVEPDEIDRINIYWAGILAMKRALEALPFVPEHLLLDARRLKDVNVPQDRIVKGDQKSLSIAAASILAKTARDARMVAFDDEYPGYGFKDHKGYPVRAHFAALEKLGACAIHRRSFAPVRASLGVTRT